MSDSKRKRIKPAKTPIKPHMTEEQLSTLIKAGIELSKSRKISHQ